MKSDKRHELQKNELADWAGHQIEAAKPHAMLILVCFIAIPAAIIFAIYYYTAEDPVQAAAWNRYFSAYSERDPKAAFNQVVTSDANSPASLWASQALGDIHLSAGSQALFSDREQAKEELAKAETALKRVAAGAKEPELVLRSRLSLGKLYEALNQPDEALKNYELAVKTDPESAIGREAAEAVERLKNPRTRELLAWFAEQKPKRPAGLEGFGSSPNLPDDLPERPDLSLPDLGLDSIGKPPAGTEGTPELPGSPLSPSSDTAPPAEAPATDKAPGTEAPPPATPDESPDAATPKAADDASPPQP